METTANSSTPQPFVFSSSQNFLGNDGKWSTFVIRIGTPGQHFEVLPASSTGEVVVPHVQGCNESDPPECGKYRGVYIFRGKASNGFQEDQSSSWSPIGLYALGIRQDLRYDVNASYGFDTVGLMYQNSGGLLLDNVTVAGIARKNYYTGLFGLGPKPANFSDFDYPQPSFMRKLRDENKIPSLSYGYTAGAYYKSPKALGSLTLGGYDESRFETNSNTFPFDPDDSRSLSLNLQGISGTHTAGEKPSTFTLLDGETNVQIDFTVPHLWLPLETCDRFAEWFGLTYDNNTDLYTVNETSHTTLLEQNSKITFAFGITSNPAERVNIELPYAAFDLEAEHPFYPNSTRYFPIRRANETSQYTLGRAFMQEVYIIADYERGNFSIHQARFPKTTDKQQIVPISLPQDSTRPGNNGTNTNAPQGANQKSLGGGPIAGIVVGVLVFSMTFLALGYLIYRRRRPVILENDTHEEYKGMPELHDVKQDHPEMPGAEIYEMKQNDEILDGVPVCELEGSRAELDGSAKDATPADENRVEEPSSNPDRE